MIPLSKYFWKNGYMINSGRLDTTIVAYFRSSATFAISRRALDIRDHSRLRRVLHEDGPEYQLQRLQVCIIQIDHGIKVAVPHSHERPERQHLR